MDPLKKIQDLLEAHKPVLGRDYERYHNHVIRVYLNCLLLDPAMENREKYAIAAVYHDIGIWTDHTFDYLAPSIAEVKKYLAGAGKSDWSDEISTMIYWHHKIKTYRGDFEKTAETFRKADWIDVSLGLLSYGGDKKTMTMYRIQFPNRGFHFFLVRQAAKNFLKHPLNPVPVFKT